MTRNLEGAYPGEGVVRPVPDVDVRQAQLSAEEGFVLSRIDGETSIEMLCMITGLGQEATVAALDGLRSKGVVRVAVGSSPGGPGGASAPAGGGASGPSDDRPQTYGGVPAAPRTGPSFPSVEEDASDPEGTGAQKQEPAGQRQPALAGGIGVVATGEASGLIVDDEELTREEAAGIDLKRGLRKRIREVRSRLNQMDFFELLDLPLNADAKEIRRAYFTRSKEFHPDRYYTKNCGPYKDMLEEVFRQVKAAYEFLQDESKRAAYQATVEEQQRSEALESEMDRRAFIDSDQDQVTGPVDPVPRRDRDGAVKSLVQRHLREQLRGKPKARPASKGQTTKPLRRPPSGEAEPPADNLARATRRDLDRIRKRRQRRNTMVANLDQQKTKAAEFFDQGRKQMEEGKTLAAAASLGLAVTYDPDNLEYRLEQEKAATASRAITAENHFKRALFEESVGRGETATLFFQRAADACPTGSYLSKAVNASLLSGDLITAREYATKAVQVAADSVEARVAMARVCLAAGQKQSARREAQLAKKLAPSSPEVKELLRQIKRS